MTKDALLPARKTPGSAGYDIRPSKSGTIHPGQEVRIPTGLSITIPAGHCGFIISRSSIFWKGIFLFGIIDEDYTGEIFITAINLGRKPRTYSNTTPNGVAQLIIMPYLAPTPTVVNKLEETTRKGGFGSTNLSVGLLQQKTGKLVFEGKLAGLNQKILFDSGADGNFIAEDIARKLHLRLSKPNNPTEITVATGQSLQIE
jgi:dUTP pyrophosphatase